MKFKYIVFMILLFAVQIAAQEYPLVTIRDIQYQNPDSLLANGDQPPALVGDTVRVKGVVMVAPYMGADPDSSVIMYAGGGTIGLFLQDADNPEWGGIFVRQTPPADPFTILDTNYVVEVTGVVNEYSSTTQKTTQLDVIKFDQTDVIGIQDRPEPVVLTLDSLSKIGTADPEILAEKWEGVYIQINNVTTFDRLSNGGFKVLDDKGTIVNIGTKSDYFYNYAPAPLDGTKLSYIRGFVETRLDYGTTINPGYRNDLLIGKFPPFISNLSRDKGFVGYGDEVTVSAIIKDNDGSVTGAELMYSTDQVNYSPLTMAVQNDTSFSAVIPAQNDSTVVSYYIQATDNEGNISKYPGNPETGAYFYLVLDRDITIQDVQYSPLGSGYSGYNGFDVTLTGIVTADTSDVEGDGGTIGAKVYMQNGSGPWSGIWLFGTEALKLTRGQEISVTGTVDENYSITRITNLDDPGSITVLGTAEVPAAYEVGTDEIATSSNGNLPAESFESVLIKYTGVTVVDENADGGVGPNESGVNNNYGEMYVADDSGVQTRVELQDGTHSYQNFWDAAQADAPNRIYTNDTFTSLTGVLFFSYSNYKLVPRKDDDFEGHVTGVKEEETIPNKFVLNQNYPNPFNPTTVISYNLPKESMVKLEVFNVIGQKVTDLVNGTQSAGFHSVNFNASDLSTGMYIYKLSAGNNVSVKKMMLLK